MRQGYYHTCLAMGGYFGRVAKTQKKNRIANQSTMDRGHISQNDGKLPCGGAKGVLLGWEELGPWSHSGQEGSVQIPLSSEFGPIFPGKIEKVCSELWFA